MIQPGWRFAEDKAIHGFVFSNRLHIIKFLYIICTVLDQLTGCLKSLIQAKVFIEASVCQVKQFVSNEMK